MTDQEKGPLPPLSRRGFLKGAGLTVAATTLTGAAAAPAAAALSAEAGPVARIRAGETVPVSFTLNGRQTVARVRTGHTLLETLRDQLDLTGTKLVCDQGTCGACTVILDGRAVNSCLVLAVEAHGHRVETIEGLAHEGRLHPLQQAFVEEDALQCGFCTPGMILSCKALLERNPSPTRDDTKEALSGNICRCGTYVGIFNAVDKAAARMRGGR